MNRFCIVMFASAALLTGALPWLSLEFAYAQTAAGTGEWKSALSRAELSLVAAKTRELMPAREQSLEQARASSNVGALRSLVLRNQQRIDTTSKIIGRQVQSIRSGKAAAAAGARDLGAVRRNFIDVVAERETYLAIQPRTIAAVSQRQGAGPAQRNAAASVQPKTPTKPVPARSGGAFKIESPEDYMANDGVMDRAEMAAEAEDMRYLCSINAYQKRYMNCDCYGREFLAQRTKRGPKADQSSIHEILTNSVETTAQCLNTEPVKQSFAAQCVDGARSERRDAADVSGFCGCVANKAIKDFQATPRFVSQWYSSLYIKAYNACKTPGVRAQYR